MEVLYIILFIVIIYLLITNKSSYNAKIDMLQLKLIELQHLVKQLSDTRPTVEQVKPVADEKPVVKKPEIEVPLKPVPQPVQPEIVEKQHEVIAPPTTNVRPPVKPVYVPHPKEPRLSFFERHPDLEKFIGENLISKIGIAILVLAIGFFVKYAIDNDWVGPVGRVAIGILCGGILIGIAHRLRKSYKAFSSVLVGGGLAVLYFTITLAYHQFHLFNQTASFIIMIVITIFAVMLSLLYNRQELAVIALIGGLASPFMVSSGHANYQALFAYLVILNAGLLVIAYHKLWRVLNACAFGLTVLIVIGVLFTLTAPTYATGFVYVSILYLMFFAINVANNVKENKKFVAYDFTILLINTSLYFAAGLYLLTMMHLEAYRGLFSACLATVNLILSFVLFKTKKADLNILYLLIGITLTFVSLTAPIQLNGHYITLFWSAEAVLLYWLYQKSKIKLMKLTALVVWCAMGISLLMDWSMIYGNSAVINIIANKGFITTVISAVSTFLLFVLINKDEADDRHVFTIPVPKWLFGCTALVLLFISGLLEVNHQFNSRYPGTDLNVLYLMLYLPVFIYTLKIIANKVVSLMFNWKTWIVMFSVTLAVYLLCNPLYFEVEADVLVRHSISALHFAAHYFGAVFIAFIFYHLIGLIKSNISETSQPPFVWVMVAAIVTFLSFELALACNLLFYAPGYPMARVETVYIKTGLPVLWGLLSFALMWLGMRYKQRTLRIISLTLFSITLLKLFFFDIRNIPPAGKIAAFFCLGVLLLIVSFMYQKVKKIIVDDEVPKA
jgi:uncharacterized membrane protein